MTKKDAMAIILPDLEKLLVGRCINGTLDSVILKEDLRKLVEEINKSN